MAHQIENNQFAYVGEAAWHGLGVEMPAGSTGQQMLVAAGLDWRVQRRAIAMRNNKGQGMVTDPLAGFRAIVRSDNDHVFQVASDRYQPVQNQDVIEFFREFCEAGHATMETVGALRDGAVIWALAKLNGGSSMTLAGGDQLKGHMLLTTSHDGSLKTIGKPCQERVVCGNTLGFALNEKSATYSLKHSSKFTDEQKGEARRVMGMAIQSIAQLNDLSAELAKVTVDHQGWMEFIGRLLGEENVLDSKTAELSRVAAEIQDSTMTSPGSGLISARGTLWGVVNGVTHYVDHKARARSDSNRLFSAWFGDGERMKNTAVRIAADMAGVTI
jgi:phage/plasmid-like protein (TIGR03299 family)